MATVGFGGGSDHDAVNAYIAHLSGVKAAVGAEGRAIFGRAKARLAAHRDTGAARIEFSRQDTDALVHLVDEAAVSIEYGREAGVDAAGRKQGAMQGLHILGQEL